MPGRIVTNKGVKVGDNEKTLLNLLLGANEYSQINNEIEKIKNISNYDSGVDIIADLSLYNAPKGRRIWEYVLNETDKMAATVPIYTALDKSGNIDKGKLVEIIEEQCECGVSIITIHPTPNDRLTRLSKKRLIPYTSRGGGIVIRDMILNSSKVNAYADILDRIIESCKKNNVVISIGSSYRSASVCDCLDRAYIEELNEQLKIANYINENHCNVMIETPGHIEIKKLIQLCDMLKEINYPIMPLGPMITDIGMEQDDLVASIGATIMGINRCADILSIVTSREHMGGIPTLVEIKRAIDKYSIVRHIIDMAKTGDMKQDEMIANTRRENKSCVTGFNIECERCGEICPLR